MFNLRPRPLSLASALLVLSLLALGIAADDRLSLQGVEGTLLVVWGDPAPGATGGGETRYSLALPDGTIFPLQLNGHENAALMNFGQRVAVSGLASESGTIEVSSIAAAKGGGPTPGTIGTRRVLYLLVKYPDDAEVPHQPSFYLNLNNPDTPPEGEVFPTTINAFFKKTSWNQFSWVGDVGGAGGIGAPGGWLTLPHPKSHYAPCGYETSCAQINALSADAMELGRAQGIDFTLYDNINFVLSNDLDCCAWGGNYFSAAENKIYGATWEPPWGQQAGTYSHEMGHSLGLPHSGWIYRAYDSPWDIMSSSAPAASVACGSYMAINSGLPRTIHCPEPGNGYIAPHKDFLGWIPPANVAVTDTSSSTTVTLEGGALPLTTGIKMLKICITGVPCDGATAHYFTAEVKVRNLGADSQYDNGIPNEGVIIHEIRRDAPRVSGTCFFNDQSGFAFPIDSTPGDFDSLTCDGGLRPFPDFALYNAQWSPGQTYTNGFSISVVSRSGANFVVSTTGKTPQKVTAVQPATGIAAGGTNVTITGTDFVPGSEVLIGGLQPTNLVVVNATTITGTTQPHVAGTVSVVVTNPLGQSSTLPGAFAYTTGVVPFTDTPLVPRTTRIKRVHITELRTRIDALRARFGALPAFVYTTDPAITAGATRIKAQHIVELRAALAPAYATATGNTATYATDPALAAGMKVKAAHIMELRALVLAIE